MEQLTNEERLALGLPIVEETEPIKEEQPPKKKRGRKPTKQQPSNSLEEARKAMFDSFGVEDATSQQNHYQSKQELDYSNVNDILSTINIDVNNVKIVDKTMVERFMDSSIEINGKPTFETVCNQSGYTANVESLKYSDIVALENSTGSIYASKQRLFKTVYNKINSTSIGKIDYETFLKITSLYDMASLEYGIYCQTFRTESEFIITCPHCKQQSEIKVNNKELLVYKNEEAFNNVQNILNTQAIPEEAIRNAAVNIRKRIILPQSKIMLDIKIPTLYKYLQILGSVKPSKLEDIESIVAIMIFIDKVYKIDLKQLIENHEVQYYELKYMKGENGEERDTIKERTEIGKIINDLEIEDSIEIQKVIQELTNTYAIEIGLKEMSCPKCNKTIDKRIIDIEQTLFFKLEQMYQIQ